MTRSSATIIDHPASTLLRRRSRPYAALLVALALAAAAIAGTPRRAHATAACVTDTGGADDINATQKDLNEFCSQAGSAGGISGCLAVDEDLTWTWDDTGWTGSNTGDACALYDTDNDGNANFALCVSVANNPATQAARVFYRCDDSKKLNCGGATAITASSSCTTSSTNDPFSATHGSGNVCNGTNCKTKDTQPHCCVKHADFPTGTTPSLIDVCSYPSSSPSSSPSECVKAVLCNADSDCSALSDACNTGKCVSDGLTKSCQATPKTNGTSCDDGDKCTTSDSCTAGVCGGTAVTCSASDQCHDVGTCDPATGTCSDPAKTDGSSCDDGNKCTENDTCTSGICSGSAVTCSALDQCHDVGTCDPGTGTCSNPSKSDGSSCDDGNACTANDSCTGGVCGGTGTTCSALDQCHVAGTCDPSTGTCTNPSKSDGASCSDGNACTQNDTCQSGSCVGGSAVTCPTPDQCHDAGTCNPETGTCSNPAKNEGAACDDGNACTQSDTCQSGTCTGTNSVTCPTPDQCHDPGTCNPTTGTCSNPNKSDGSTCNDGNACTQTDTCQSGTCTGSNPVTCSAQDQCHDAGTCDPATGNCSNPNTANGSPCSDGDACTTGDTCTNGSCTPGTAVTCSALDQCHDVGTCDSSTGTCSNPNKADGSPCDDGVACTLNDTCQSGTCTGGNGPSAQPGCKNDTGGPDDAVGQKDLTQFCVNTSASCAGTIFKWQWDDTAWSGTNTGDACALYDTDGDKLANYALCVSVQGNPAVKATGSPKFYRCGDTKQFNCTSPTLLTFTSTCVVNDGTADPFAASSRRSNKCAGTNCLTKDTQAQCCVNTADLPATATLIDVCSYPSSSPNSDPSECVKTVFCSSNADCTVSGCTGRCTSVAGVNQCVF